MDQGRPHPSRISRGNGYLGVVPKPIAALDVDGTLGDHYQHTVNFARLWLGRDIKYTPENGWPDGATKFQFARAMGLSKSTYRQIKLAYRQGGMVRSMPLQPGAKELVDHLRKCGMAVWICTTRPYLRLDTMAVDTSHWLKRNGLRVDGLIATDYKYHDLVRAVGKSNVVAALDDLPEMCEQAVRAGVRPIMIMRPHNVPSFWDGDEVGNLEDAALLIEKMFLEMEGR
jgi:phosphoserine phosphatase